MNIGMYVFVCGTINLPCIIFQLFTFNWGHKHQKQLLLLLQQQLQQELQHQQQNSDTHNKYTRTASTGSTRILFSFYIYTLLLNTRTFCAQSTQYSTTTTLSRRLWMILISAVMLWLGWFLISYYFWHILITFSHFFGKFW